MGIDIFITGPLELKTCGFILKLVAFAFYVQKSGFYEHVKFILFWQLNFEI